MIVLDNVKYHMDIRRQIHATGAEVGVTPNNESRLWAVRPQPLAGADNPFINHASSIITHVSPPPSAPPYCGKWIAPARLIPDFTSSFETVNGFPVGDGPKEAA